ncbi:tRNA (guanine(26)-N(2)/guanine(27)-N(2))-dimethyltransferase [Nanoarchaeota archaeon]
MNEGKAIINYNPDFLNKLSSKLPVFYNPLMKINRDTTILILKSYYDLFRKKLKILDCMSATGIRSIRIIKEIPEVIDKIYINDIKKEAYENILENIKLNNIELNENIKILNKDCRELLIKEKFDYIDIDPFGTPIGFIELLPLSLKNYGIAGITATDVSSLSGSKSKSCLRKYNTIGIKTDFYLEFGIRNLAKYIIIEGLKYDIAFIPIFAYYYKHHYRIYIIKSRKSKDIKYLLENIKEIYYCNNCGYKSLEDKKCKICNSDMKKLGPIYIGNLYDNRFLEKIKENLNLIDINKEEEKIFNRIFECDSKMNIWYYYDIRKISSYYKKNLPKIDEIIKNNNGCRTHFSDYGIKTYEYPKI